EVLGPQPLAGEACVGPGVEQQPARRIEDASDDQHALGWNQYGRSGHDSAPAIYFSASVFRLARPSSKSLPIMLSRLRNTCMTFEMNGAGPSIAQVTVVASFLGIIVNSAVL